MSMELHVLSDKQVTSIAEWQRAIDAERFPLRLVADINVAAVDGFLPATLDGRETGFECFHDDASETMKDLGVSSFDHAWRFALGLRWLGSRIDELYAAWMAAAAYAEATGGVIFDHEEGKVLSPRQARASIAKLVRDRPRAEALMEEVRKRFEAGGRLS